MKRSILVVLVVAALGTLMIPFVVSAQETTEGRSVTITEEQINDSFAVTNPSRRRASDVVVDLQAGQVQLSFDWSNRRPDDGVANASVSSIWAPLLENGRLFWTLESATVDGEPASEEMMEQINTQLSSRWRNYMRRHMPRGWMTNVTITDTEMTIQLAPPMI
ncbi:MAG: hypothetical protein IAE89_10185 [Anaerolineae bacterium]|nr:hypothetical protein [Anaerolineae bacterium]